MNKHTSVSLGSHYESFINSEVESGRFDSANDVIRTALSLLENETKRNALIEALELGEQSGFVDNFDPKEHLKKLHKRKNA